MRIYIGDLGYPDESDFAQPAPLNAGFLAAYLTKRLPEVECEIFKDPRRLLARCEERPPRVLALSNYEWNSNLNHQIMTRVKRRAPDVITVCGGPNFNAADDEWIGKWMGRRPELDLYLVGEGEESFHRLIAQLIESGNRPGRIPMESLPETVIALNGTSGVVERGKGGKVDPIDCSTIPSPYLTGWMDPFLADDHLAPIIETNRGCPYSCAYCWWGQATQSKIRQFDLNTIIAEIKYVAENSRNPRKLLYIADGNFGILKRDITIARAIQETAGAFHGFPQSVYVYFAKNTTNSVIEIAAMMRSQISMSMSKQSLNESVLDNIGRTNISNATYDTLRHECERLGITTYCELIAALPGETYESFVNGVCQTIRSGQSVILHGHLMLAGAKTADKAYREKWGIRSAFRIMPRYVGSFGDIHSLEYEECVVETNCFSRDDFFKMRVFQLLIHIFSSLAFSDLSRELRALGSDHGTLARRVADDRDGWNDTVADFFARFTTLCVEELIEKEDTKIDFTSEDIAIAQKLRQAKIPLMFAHLVASREMAAGFRNYLEVGAAGLLGFEPNGAAARGLAVALGLSFDRLVNYEKLSTERSVSYPYDLEAWSSDENNRSVVEFETSSPRRYTLRHSARIGSGFTTAMARTGSVSESVYLLRMHMFPMAAGEIFAFARTKAE